MTNCRYTATRKAEAVRRVVEDGWSVGAVAREMGVGEGSLFFWVRRYRQMTRDCRTRAPLPPAVGEGAQQFGTFVAYLRRTRR